MSNILEMRKIQTYMAASQEEYDKALAWIRDCKEVYEIKEVGHMLSTDWYGNDLDTYIFLFAAPSTVMMELGKYMTQPATMVM